MSRHRYTRIIDDLSPEEQAYVDAVREKQPYRKLVIITCGGCQGHGYAIMWHGHPDYLCVTCRLAIEE